MAASCLSPWDLEFKAGLDGARYNRGMRRRTRLGLVIAILVDTVLAQVRMHVLPPPAGRFRPPPTLLGNVLRFQFLYDYMVYLAVFAAALARTKVVVRGPKPLAAVRELQVPVWVTVPEPNTWRELLAAIDARAAERPLAGARIAVQEYGVPNTELIDSLRERGAVVTRVPVYRWALPKDLEPLKHAVRAIARGEVDVMMFTTGVQVVHLWQIVGEMQLEADVMRELARAMVVSIGPTTSEELRRHGLSPDLEPSHPKIGFLVREAAEQSAAVLRAKRIS